LPYESARAIRAATDELAGTWRSVAPATPVGGGMVTHGPNIAPYASLPAGIFPAAAVSSATVSSAAAESSRAKRIVAAAAVSSLPMSVPLCVVDQATSWPPPRSSVNSGSAASMVAPATYARLPPSWK
jgi:hypothetical protein